MLDQKVHSIRVHFQRVLGYRLKRYETAETFFHGEWFPDPSIPILLFVNEKRLVSILWDFDRLWLERDRLLPPGADLAATRWKSDSLPPLNPLVGGLLKSVRLGRGEASAAGQEIPVWTRLFIEVDDWCLEVFGTPDGNGYAVMSELPLCETILCATQQR